jgi:uncharacterized protein (UPF0332 family)
LDETYLLFKESEKTLEAAKLLFKNEYYGDAINRSYYAMFYAAKALLIKKEISTKTHKGIVSKFYEEFVENGKMEIRIFKLFTKTQDDRNKADYDLFTNFAKNKTKK